MSIFAIMASVLSFVIKVTERGSGRKISAWSNIEENPSLGLTIQLLGCAAAVFPSSSFDRKLSCILRRSPKESLKAEAMLSVLKFVKKKKSRLLTT